MRTDATTGAGAVKAGVDAWSAGDYPAAVRLWQPLADRGDPDALFNLAQAYKLGRGVAPDLAKAEDLYGRAAARGHLQAADSYGLLLFQRGEREKALPYVQASASRGDPRAMYILGVAHFNGDIVPKDWVRAYALVSLARQAGLPQAAHALAQMDAHIPLADRQKSVILSQQIAAETDANRQRTAAAAELGTPTTTAAATAADTPSRGPQIVAVDDALDQAERVAGSSSPATAGADYTRAGPSVATARPIPRPEPTKGPPQSTPKPTPKPATVATTPKPVETPRPRPAESSRPSTGGAWRVQLGAFGVAGNAEALWAKLRGRPELAGHPRALVPAGKLTKLQATGFASQAEAQSACSKLSAAGFTCVVARD